MTLFGNLNSARIPSGFLNSTNDPAPGQIVDSPSGSIVQAYAGQVGMLLPISAADALDLSDTTVGALYPGVYMYVKFKAGTTASPAKGLVCFWDDIANSVVTVDATAANVAKVAGIVLNSVTKGNYGWIQVAGQATVKGKATLTKAGADGDLAMVDAAPGNTMDVLADATGLVSPNAKAQIGILMEAVTNGALAKVLLRFPKIY